MVGSPASPVRRGRRRTMTAGAADKLDGQKGRDHEVLAVAIDLFWEQGYAATSVQDVADRLGMLKGSLYYYIKGKEDLLKRIFQDSHAEGLRIIDGVRASGLPPLEQLRMFINEWALWYLTNFKRTSLYAREWRQTGPDLREDVIRQRQEYDRFLVELITAAQESKDLDPSIDSRLATFYVMSAVSSIPDWYYRSRSRPASMVAEAYTDYSLRLLGHRPPV
jgi:TetR/AcrR family transcriptional regulator, cholesterol catabolism regulator